MAQLLGMLLIVGGLLVYGLMKFKVIDTGIIPFTVIGSWDVLPFVIGSIGALILWIANNWETSGEDNTHKNNVSKDDPVIEKTVSLDPKKTEGEKIQLKVYEFDICGKKTIKNPTYEIISQAFNDVLNGVCGDDSFLILSVANIDGTYVQMALLPDRKTIQLEYQDGAEDKHFESTGNPSSSETINAFVKYSQGSKTWDDGFSWRRIKI